MIKLYRSSASNNQPLVTVVVTTKNEEKHIENCLKSIQLQTYANIEVIVVDNNSDDGTKAIALAYTKMVFNKGPERSAQRNYGMIQASNGVYVMYLDADMILSPSLIADCISELNSNEGTVALYISEIVLGSNFWSKVRRFERSFYDGTVIDCVRFMRRNTFIKVGGFDLTMTGPEDWDLDKKIRNVGNVKMLHQREVGNQNQIVLWGKEFSDFLINRGVNWLHKGSVVYHNESEFKISGYMQKKAYYVNSFDIYIHKWGKGDPDVKKQFGTLYRFIGVFIENRKWEKLVTHPLLTIGMYFLRGIVGILFIRRKNCLQECLTMQWL